MQVWNFSLEKSPASRDNYASALHTERVSRIELSLYSTQVASVSIAYISDNLVKLYLSSNRTFIQAAIGYMLNGSGVSSPQD